MAKLPLFIKEKREMRKKQKSRFVMKSLLHYENESTYGLDHVQRVGV